MAVEGRDGRVRAGLPEGGLLMGPVYHPHSICRVSTDELAIRESPRRRVITSTGRRSGLLPGYSRGLCWAGDSLWVGTSRQRRSSEEASTLEYTPSTAPMILVSARSAVLIRGVC